VRILILNWRDVRSSRGGGAERLTHEVARGLVGRGHEVAWLSSAERGAPQEELIDGVRVIRRGSELTTRLHARSLARSFDPDVILEEINTLPYFGPLWASAPVVLYMNQLARDVWWYEAPLPLAAVGWTIEPAYLQVYRRCHAVTISASSRDDLRRLGVGTAITVVPLAVDVPTVATPRPRGRYGRMVAVGRLTPSKRYDHAISALRVVVEDHPDATLTIVGRGADRARLERHAHELGLADKTFFAGAVDEQAKIELLDGADVLVGTSVREGWGLTVNEAAARAIPAVVYDIPGFRDAVVDGRTGLVVDPNPEALGRAVSALLSDEARYERIRLTAWEQTKEVTHEMTTDAFESALRAAARRE
jgi:glycosyltransferase involved in cell wall biosynthesis